MAILQEKRSIKKFKYCLQCSESLEIICDNPRWHELEKSFNLLHSGHLVSILSEEEIYQHEEQKLLVKKIKLNNKLIREYKDLVKEEPLIDLEIVVLQRANHKLKSLLQNLPFKWWDS